MITHSEAVYLTHYIRMNTGLSILETQLMQLIGMLQPIMVITVAHHGIVAMKSSMNMAQAQFTIYTHRTSTLQMPVKLH